MVLKYWFSKIKMYFKYEGPLYAFQRSVQKFISMIFGDLIYYGRKNILFYADLKSRGIKEIVLPKGVSIECCECKEDVSQQDWEIFCRHFRENYLQSTMKERFGKGALLWLLKVKGTLAGYIWTIRGTTINPYVRLLMPDEVNFFDNMVFENFRGRGINPVLVNYVLSEMQKQNCIRAFIETRTTNIAEIRSLAKTDFRKYGLARSHLSWKHSHLSVGWEILSATVDFSENPVEMQVYTNFDRLSQIQPEWDHFVESLNCDIFLTYDWCRIWWKYYGGNKALRIFVFRCKGELVGVLPTYIEKIGIGPTAVKIARIVGTTYVLAEINPSVKCEYIRQVFGKWLELLYSEFNPDIVCIGPIPGMYDKTDQLVSECAAWGSNRFVVEKRKAGVLTIFRIGSTLEEYLASLPGKNKREIDRDSRNILKAAPDKNARLVFESISASQLHGAFDDFIRMHNVQWQRLGQSGHFNDWPLSEKFHREVAEEQEKRGCLRFFKICVGQTCIGYEYAYKFSHTYFHYLNTRTFAKEFERVSVGKVNFCELVKKAVSESVNLINSMRGKYEYKIRMGGVLVPTYAVLIFRQNMLLNLRVRTFKLLSRLLHLCYYRIWFSRIAPRLPWRRHPLWNLWIRTNVFA